MTTYQIRISTRYADDHLETSSLPGTEIRRTKAGVTLELTLGELAELASRAGHLADPHYGRELADSGLADLHRSAKKVVEQLKRETYGPITLWELAHAKGALEAYDREWDAMWSARHGIDTTTEIKEMVTAAFS